MRENLVKEYFPSDMFISEETVGTVITDRLHKTCVRKQSQMKEIHTLPNHRNIRRCGYPELDSELHQKVSLIGEAIPGEWNWVL